MWLFFWLRQIFFCAESAYAHPSFTAFLAFAGAWLSATCFAFCLPAIAWCVFFAIFAEAFAWSLFALGAWADAEFNVALIAFELGYDSAVALPSFFAFVALAFAWRLFAFVAYADRAVGATAFAWASAWLFLASVASAHAQ